jgi:voltage-gated potassium channel
MNSPLNRLRAGLLLLGTIFVVAVFGYWMAGWDLIDAVYMVVITLSTVGYKEVHSLTWEERLFTILVIFFGVSTVLYIMGVFVQMMTEGEINRALGLRRVTKEIERLTDHVIVCGFGRMGEILARELHRQRLSFVVLENDPERVTEAALHKYLALNDNSTEEDALLLAGIERAKTLVTTLPRDADNVFITLTARNLNPKLMIIARGEFPTTEKKLLQAGADRVVLPAATGALRMAAMITRPSAVELIEVVAGRQNGRGRGRRVGDPSRQPSGRRYGRRVADPQRVRPADRGGPQPGRQAAVQPRRRDDAPQRRQRDRDGPPGRHRSVSGGIRHLSGIPGGTAGLSSSVVGGLNCS